MLFVCLLSQNVKFCWWILLLSAAIVIHNERAIFLFFFIFFKRLNFVRHNLIKSKINLSLSINKVLKCIDIVFFPLPYLKIVIANKNLVNPCSISGDFACFFQESSPFQNILPKDLKYFHYVNDALLICLYKTKLL